MFSSAADGRSAGKAAVLADLRRRIAHIERPGSAGNAIPLGLPLLDAALPDGGLPLSAVHELIRGERPGDDAATGFAAALLARLAEQRGGHVLWLSRTNSIYPPGLAAYGLRPERLLVMGGLRGHSMLWAVEEGLKSGAVAGVVAEVEAVTPVAGRRLQLAAEDGGVVGLLLRLKPGAPVTSAVTRWRVTAVGGAVGREPGVGQPRWQVDLLHSRGGRSASCVVTWSGDGWLAEATPEVTAHAPVARRTA